MIDIVKLKLWLEQLEELAPEDEAVNKEDQLLVRTRARELQAAQEKEELSARMAKSSRAALERTREQIRQLLAAGTEAHSSSPRPPERVRVADQPLRGTVADVIYTFLEERKEATYSEITAQVGKMRPDVRAENCARDLGRLVTRGLLVRPRTGVYRIVEKETESLNS
ncbi:hypothetical protein ABTZ59_33495 [Streptomyces sp. NPDC094034]|uniref:hypothetical protein n=1 Tax=Streptomyces sp. NPDC094034 TaxID=3155309 RepID=UPI00331E5A5C